jgi:hypothetical protein
MESTEKVKGPASYFPSIEKNYGQPVEHWFGILRAAGSLPHMALVSMLKTEHGLGHGHANALVAYHLDKGGRGVKTGEKPQRSHVMPNRKRAANPP